MAVATMTDVNTAPKGRMGPSPLGFGGITAMPATGPPTVPTQPPPPAAAPNGYTAGLGSNALAQWLAQTRAAANAPPPGQGQSFTTVAPGGQPYLAGATYPANSVIDYTNNTVYPAGTIRRPDGTYMTPSDPNYGYFNNIPGQASGDPFFIQQQGLLSAQNLADRADVAQQAQRALIQYGAIPEGQFSDLLGITDATRQLAEQSTGSGLSTLARIQHAAENARRLQLDQLAARGMLSSGETGFQLGELALQRQQSEYDALQEVLDRLYGMQSAFGQADTQRRLALFDAAINAYQRGASRVANRAATSFGSAMRIA